ncbi:hypothetical protein HF295_06895 [Hujiaoplasma nucleasis]|uniref:Uncharacterized protein n=1 Tax=Hujiaoplasma nucleasis TaxID=2725268 RepID=A0A7L6N334_9MOLU|nr:hypothetical protein [Hujiaoplasma nucleasis]QLY40583.1 hypothetical protein HF295_06895 [Hujiaoplasma nucleasis]
MVNQEIIIIVDGDPYDEFLEQNDREPTKLEMLNIIHDKTHGGDIYSL